MIPFLQELRGEITGLMGPCLKKGSPPFLKRAAGEEYLFLCDGPRRIHTPDETAARLKEAGYALWEKGGLWLIDAPISHYASLWDNLPKEAPPLPQDENLLQAYTLSRRLLQNPPPLFEQPLGLARSALKAAEEGEQTMRYFCGSILPPALALLLRKKAPLPSLAGGVIAAWLWDKMKESGLIACDWKGGCP